MRLLPEKIAENPGVSPGSEMPFSLHFTKRGSWRTRPLAGGKKHSPRSGQSAVRQALGLDCLAGAGLGLPRLGDV